MPGAVIRKNAEHLVKMQNVGFLKRYYLKVKKKRVRKHTDHPYLEAKRLNPFVIDLLRLGIQDIRVCFACPCFAGLDCISSGTQMKS